MSDQVVYLNPPKHTLKVITSTELGVMIGRQYHVSSGDLDEEMLGTCSGPVTLY